MTSRKLLVIAGYVEMALAGLFGGATLLSGPLMLGPASGSLARVATDGDAGAALSQLKLVELGCIAVVFALGLLLLISAACVRPEPQSISGPVGRVALVHLTERTRKSGPRRNAPVRNEHRSPSRAPTTSAGARTSL